MLRGVLPHCGRPSRRGLSQSFPKFLTSQATASQTGIDGHTLEAAVGAQGSHSPPAWTSLKSSHLQYGSSARPGAGWPLPTSRHPSPQPPLEEKAGCLSNSCSRHDALGSVSSELARQGAAHSMRQALLPTPIHSKEHGGTEQFSNQLKVTQPVSVAGAP